MTISLMDYFGHSAYLIIRSPIKGTQRGGKSQCGVMQEQTGDVSTPSTRPGHKFYGSRYHRLTKGNEEISRQLSMTNQAPKGRLREPQSGVAIQSFAGFTPAGHES